MRLRTMKNKKRPGFTLVEMVIVITILGILSGLGFMKFDQVQTKAKENADYVAASNLATAVELFRNEKPEWVSSTEGTIITSEQLKANLYIRQIPKSQSEKSDFLITIGPDKEIIIEAGGKQFYPKIEGKNQDKDK